MSARQHFRFKMDGQQPTWQVYESKGGTLLTALPVESLSGDSADLIPTISAANDLPRQACKTVTDLIHMWKSPEPDASSPEWKALAPNTQRTWGGALRRIEQKWGGHALAAFDDPAIKSEIVAWRNSYARHPRGADIGVVVLQALLRFGLLLGIVRNNPAYGIPSLYRGGDRAEIIWTDDELEQMAIRSRQMGLDRAVDALRLAAACGLRRDDLVTLQWEHIGKFAISKKARKSSRKRRRYVSIPRLTELDALLQEFATRPRQAGVENVLVDRSGKPWHPDRLTRQIAQVRDALGIAYVDPETGTRRKKHLHDARGTYATRLIRSAGVSDEAVADIMGWSPSEVARIRRVYVDQTVVAEAVGELIYQRSRPAGAGRFSHTFPRG